MFVPDSKKDAYIKMSETLKQINRFGEHKVMIADQTDGPLGKGRDQWYFGPGNSSELRNSTI